MVSLNLLKMVKSERHDDPEINEMARKIAEQNRHKVGLAPPPGVHGGPLSLARPGQPTLHNYLPASGSSGGCGPGGASKSAEAKAKEEGEKKIDNDSRRGRFGWCEFEKNYIPFVFRGANADKYTSVRMVERKFLCRFLTVLPPEVNSCHCIRSYYITDGESKLLNEINLKHADCYFGKEAFTTKDLVVRLKDAKEFYRFLDLCYKKLVLKKSNASDRCGFFRINGESVVPYTVRENVKYVPLFYFEGETDHLKLKSDQVDGWDLAYLKFCCKVQGIRNELFAAEVCRVVALEEIKGHFPPGTTFEDYWPAKGSIEPVNAQRNPVGNWTQKPPSATSSSSSSKPMNFRSHPYDMQQAAASSNYHQLFRAAGLPMPHGMTAPHLGQHLQSKQFPGKLTQIKEFPLERSQQPPYKLQKALIDQKIVPCINVRPYVFHDLMMTFPDFVKHFCPELSMERTQQILQEILKIVLYKGNK